MVYVEICLPNSIFGTRVNRQSAAFSNFALVDWSSHTKPGDLYPWMCCLASHENVQIASFWPNHNISPTYIDFPEIAGDFPY